MAIVDSSGNSQKSYQYDVYGDVTGGSGSLANEFDFAGQQTDATGPQYLRARYYDPATGTFLSREPLAALAGWTGLPYAYAGGAPTMATDPSGLRLEDGTVSNWSCSLGCWQWVPYSRVEGLTYLGPDWWIEGWFSSDSTTPTTFRACTFVNGVRGCSDSNQAVSDAWKRGLEKALAVAQILVPLAGEYGQAATNIANGHAFDEHWHQFDDIKSRRKVAEEAQRIMQKAKGRNVKKLENGSTAYWDGDTIVIRDPSAPDGGTMFKPDGGRAYFDGLP